jgi:hypothetical protein
MFVAQQFRRQHFQSGCRPLDEIQSRIRRAPLEVINRQQKTQAAIKRNCGNKLLLLDALATKGLMR